MKVEKEDLMGILDVVTYGLKRVGGEEITLIGGSALMILGSKRGTIDVDTFVNDVNLFLEKEEMEKLLKEIGKKKGYMISRLGFRHPGTTYFTIVLPNEREFNVEILNTLEKRIEADEIIAELGSFTFRRVNDIEVKCPTYESIFVMKLLSYDVRRPKDLNDVKWLHHYINQDNVIAFCVDHKILPKYESVFGEVKREKRKRRRKREPTNGYPTLYQLALKLPKKTLRIALKRLHYPIPKSHKEKAKLYARHYANKKSEKKLREFKYYVRWKGKRSKK